MARRSSPARSKGNEIAVIILGLRSDGDIVRIAAYQSGSSVRLSGPNGRHNVHPSNQKTVEGWRHEAALAWRLSDTYSVHPMDERGEHERERYEELKAKSAERKRQLEDAKAKSGMAD